MPLPLTYALTTLPQPLMASPVPPQGDPAEYNYGSLTLVATNGTGAGVLLTFLELSFPVGPAATDLTDAAHYTSISVVADPTWKADPKNPYLTHDIAGQVTAAAYRFTPQAGYGTLPNKESLAFAFNDVTLSALVGTAQLTLTGAGQPTQTLAVTKFPAGWDSLSFSALPSILTTSQAATLSWNGPAGAVYALEYYDFAKGTTVNLPASGQAPLPHVDSLPSEVLTQTTVFYLTVTYTDAAGTAYPLTVEQTVTVTAAPIITTFTGAMTWTDGYPQLLLSWVASPETIVTITGSTAKWKATDSWQISPTARQPILTTYTLTATNAAGVSAMAQLTATWALHGSVESGIHLPWAIAFPADGHQAWIANRGAGTVTVLNTASLQPVPGSPVPGGGGPMNIAFTTDGRQAWIVNINANNVTVLDTASLQPVPGSPVSAGRWPTAIAFTSDGHQAWIVNNGDSTVTVLDTTSLQPVPGSPIRVGSVGSEPGAIAFTSDGRQAWVMNNRGTVTVLDTTSLQPVPGSPVRIWGSLQDIAFTMDGCQAWVVDYDNKITVVDTASRQSVSGIPLPVVKGFSRIAFTPDGSQAWVVNSGGGKNC